MLECNILTVRARIKRILRRDATRTLDCKWSFYHIIDIWLRSRNRFCIFRCTRVDRLLTFKCRFSPLAADTDDHLDLQKKKNIKKIRV